MQQVDPPTRPPQDRTELGLGSILRGPAPNDEDPLLIDEVLQAGDVFLCAFKCPVCTRRQVWSQERRRDVVQSPSRVMVNNPLNEWTREGDATFIAASRTDIPKLLDALDAAEERERVLRDALEWYAKRRHYEYDFESGSPVWIDNGSRAREALAATKGES
jgi:hypothetical protein